MAQEKWTLAHYRDQTTGAVKNDKAHRMSAKEYKKEVKADDHITETPLSKQIEQLFNLHGLENDRLQSGKLVIPSVYKSKVTGKTTKHTRVINLAKTGTPDRWCLIHSRWCLFEVKTKGKEATPAQKLRHKQLRAAGAIVVTVDSFEAAEQMVKELKHQLDPQRLITAVRFGLINFFDKMSGSALELDQAAEQIIKEIEKFHDISTTTKREINHHG